MTVDTPRATGSRRSSSRLFACASLAADHSGCRVIAGWLAWLSMRPYRLRRPLLVCGCRFGRVGGRPGHS